MATTNEPTTPHSVTPSPVTPSPVTPSPVTPSWVIPRPRMSPERMDVLADDRLIEDVRAGRITEDNCDGVACLLVHWRAFAAA